MKGSSGFYNDGSQEPPRLQIFLDLDTLIDLPSDSLWLQSGCEQSRDRLCRDGFEGIQLTSNEIVLSGVEMPHCGLDRISKPEEADAILVAHAGKGDLCITVHAGWGLEDELEACRLVDAILTASNRHGLPVFIETHRATITQDLWRTVQLIRAFPEIRLNGDFSHYYCGQELAYGDWSQKMSFMEPIFERTGFMHGRIASPGCMQVPLDADLSSRPLQAHGAVDYLEHFRELWTRAMAGFIRNSNPGDVLIFAPELLSGLNYYARLFPGTQSRLVEESDRYQQALFLNQLASQCFATARKSAIEPQSAACEPRGALRT